MNKSTLAAVSILESALNVFREFTNDGDVQVQTIQLFFQICAQQDTSLDYQQLADRVGITQPAISRNMRKMVTGARMQEGYGLITIELGEMDARRRIVRLSKRGKELAALIENRMMPGLIKYVNAWHKEGVQS